MSKETPRFGSTVSEEVCKFEEQWVYRPARVVTGLEELDVRDFSSLKDLQVAREVLFPFDSDPTKNPSDQDHLYRVINQFFRYFLDRKAPTKVAVYKKKSS